MNAAVLQARRGSAEERAGEQASIRMTKFRRMAQSVNRSGVLFFAIGFPLIVVVIWILLVVAAVIWPGCCG